MQTVTVVPTGLREGECIFCHDLTISSTFLFSWNAWACSACSDVLYNKGAFTLVVRPTKEYFVVARACMKQLKQGSEGRRLFVNEQEMSKDTVLHEVYWLPEAHGNEVRDFNRRLFVLSTKPLLGRRHDIEWKEVGQRFLQFYEFCEHASAIGFGASVTVYPPLEGEESMVTGQASKCFCELCGSIQSVLRYRESADSYVCEWCDLRIDELTFTLGDERTYCLLDIPMDAEKKKVAKEKKVVPYEWIGTNVSLLRLFRTHPNRCSESLQKVVTFCRTLADFKSTIHGMLRVEDPPAVIERLKLPWSSEYVEVVGEP